VTVQIVPFLDVFEDESGGNIKTPQSEYLPIGKYPVVDQGKAVIAGYVDDKSRICGDGRPAIVFGDHTRCVKYAGFPFCMGADGVKVLRPKIEADLKYLYYFLSQLEIPNAGYDRHYKYLKRTEVVLQPLHEQRRIATILDQADTLRAKRREALIQLDSLTHSIFIEMFGDPRQNERKWKRTPIGSFISDMRGGAPLEPDDFTDSGFPILHKGAIKHNGAIHLDAKKKTFASLEYAASKPRCVADRAFVAVTLRDLVPTGPSIGLVADLRHGPYDSYLLAQGAYAFRLDRRIITPEYFVHLSNMPTFRYVLRQNAVGSTQIHIRTPIYRAISVPIPPIELQDKFAERINAVDSLKLRSRCSLADLDALFASIQHRAFRGEL